MPIYEYFCPSCEKKFEELVYETKPKVVSCPKCGKPEVNRLISSFAMATGADSPLQMGGESGGHGCGCGSCACGQG